MIRQQKLIEEESGYQISDFSFATVRDLTGASDEDLKNFITIVYKDKDFRFVTEGVTKTSLSATDAGFLVSWSHNCGDPQIAVTSLDDNICFSTQGRWNYTLMKLNK